MKLSLNYRFLFSTLLCVFLLSACEGDKPTKVDVSSNQSAKVLIFTKTKGWRHKSIEPGRELLQQALQGKGMQVQLSEDASIFNDRVLSEFSAIVFFNTTGDILNSQQQVAMERYIQAGGGYVGIHSATDTEWQGDWIWYRRLVGGVFAGHPNVPSNVQTARIQVLDKNHASTAHLPDNFLIADEWYDFKSLSDRRIDLMKVDERSYNGGGHKGYHPIAWYHDFDGGRSFYTGIGHNAENFKKPLFMDHLLGGIEYAIGENVRDYTKSRPEPNRFVKETLLEGLNEPISLDITKDGNGIIFIERKGKVSWFDVPSKVLSEVGQVPVHSAEGFGEFGLLALALDPNFDTNQHVFMMYNLDSSEDDAGPLQRVSRFTLVDGKLDLSSEVPMLETGNEDTCCHTGGNMDFDAQGNLFIALGDNTNPFEAFGVGPSDFRDGREAHDAYRSSGNTQDFRGKILRITPQADASYTIPKGNLFADPANGKPEIYVMGTRNPYALAYDDKENILYYGDVGPDAKEYTEEHGSRGFDEINRVRQAGNFGWPMFIGNNQAYRQFNYDTNIAGKWNNPLQPQNTSPRNTGIKQLPPAQPALIWYPYASSERFPELGEGGRNALVAGVYRSTGHADGLPSYYDGGLFISDFMRRWIKVAFTDEKGDLYKLEEFVPDADLVAPIDLKFSHQGQLYILEYGSKWHSGNADSKLSRIVYTGPDNRPPQANMSSSLLQGSVPLTVNASGVDSTDPDNNPLTYIWQLARLATGQDIDQADLSQTPEVKGMESTFAIEEKGRYVLALTVTDDQHESSTQRKLVEVGNAPPSVDLRLIGDQSFLWPGKPMSKYQVVITDQEDGDVTQDSPAFERVSISFGKVQKEDEEQTLGHQVSGPLDVGRKASKKRLCIGCHQEQGDSVGPAFQKVADKYLSKGNPEEYLKQSIAAGSVGKWGQHQMPAHDFLSDEVLTVLAQYILALKSLPPSLPLSGVLQQSKGEGLYQLKATYTDSGADGLSAISREKTLTVRSPKILARSLISHRGAKNGLRARRVGGVPVLAMSGHKTKVLIGKMDLRQVQSITLSQKYATGLNKHVKVELRVGRANGKVLAAGQFNYDGANPQDVIELTLDVSQANTYRPLYLVVNILDEEKGTLAANMHAITFNRK